jgi:hypothetical protein
MRSRAALGMFLFLCLFAVSSLHAESDVRTFTIRFAQQNLETRQYYLAEDAYDLIEIEELDLTGLPGHPCLPVKDMQIYVPRGSRLTEVRVISQDQMILPGEYLLLPGQHEIPLSSEVMPEPMPPDERIYMQPDPYPGSTVRLATSGSIGGRKVSCVQVFPLQYVPARRQVILNREITFELEFEDANVEPAVPRETPNVRKLRNSIVARLVENPEDIDMDFPPDLGTLDPSVATEYLIISHQYHVDEYQLLKDWKTRKGIPATIRNRPDVLASYPGRDDPERLRNCIMDYYLNESTVWVLMTMSAPKANIRGCYCRVGGTIDTAIPCDLYFADMDGDWNQDNDSYWGETTDDVDLYPDVYVGRLPGNTGEQAAVGIHKVLTYEGCYGLPADYQLEMLFLAEYADAQTDGAIAKNMIDNESVPARFDPITKLYESSGNLNKTSAMNALNAGMGIINHDGHGNSSTLSIGPGALHTEDMMALTNAPRYSVFYTLACTPGNFDNMTGFFGKGFLQAADGGGFFIGNSRYGWYWPGNPGYGTGERFDREFFQSMFVRDYDHLGVIHADAKVQRIPYSGSNNTDRWTQFTSNLFGDPETPVWKDTPVQLTASHADSIQAGNHMMTITVSAEGSPVDQARVCLWKEEEIYLVDETDGSGEVEFQFSASDSGGILLTATKNGYIPYLGSMQVQGNLSGLTGHDDLARRLQVSVSPNPVTKSAAISFALPGNTPRSEQAQTRISIYYASGRLVRTLPVEQTGKQAGAMSWDGKLESGTAAPAGIYFLNLSHGDEAATAKFVMLR